LAVGRGPGLSLRQRLPGPGREGAGQGAVDPLAEALSPEDRLRLLAGVPQVALANPEAKAGVGVLPAVRVVGRAAWRGGPLEDAQGRRVVLLDGNLRHGVVGL